VHPLRLRLFASIASLVLGLSAIVAAQSAAAAVALGPAGQLAVAGIATALGLVFLALAGALGRRVDLSVGLALRGNRVPPKTLIAFVAGALGLSHLFDRILRSTSGWSGSALGEFERIISGAEPAEVLLLIVGIAVAPGFAEELLFRGTLLSALRTRLPAPRSVLYSSLFFGALHLDPLHIVGAFGLGMYFGAITVATGSIRTAVCCHIVNNLAAVLLAKLAFEDSGAFVSGSTLIALAATCTGLIVLRRKLRESSATVLH
jgi:membrane protease YdiL (CAAX protease family)